MTIVRYNDEAVILDMGIHVENYIRATENEDLEKISEKQLIHAEALPHLEKFSDLIPIVKAIIPTHAHLDHVGGRKWARQKSFSLTNRQSNLGIKNVYTPITMTYPGLKPICTFEPTVIAKGIATIGVITNYGFLLGQMLEQSLAINVKGKGHYLPCFLMFLFLHSVFG